MSPPQPGKQVALSASGFVLSGIQPHDDGFLARSFSEYRSFRKQSGASGAARLDAASAW
jgi:hypothetical protein